MTSFLYAGELKKIFVVYGSFYDLRLPDGDVVSCRNSLEIYRRNHPGAARATMLNYEYRPDAAVVMMNPGSSKPAAADYEIPVFYWEERLACYEKAAVIPTVPDNAQYQIMRVMQERGLFIVKGGVEKAASALGGTRYTVYNYLEQLRGASQ